VNILEATADPQLFARWFRDRSTWQPWFAYLAAIFALPMSPEQLEIFRACTGLAEPPKETSKEIVTICGRRAGKSFVLSLIAVYLACFFDWRPYMTPGERAYVMIIAADRKQARTIFRYIKALITEVPMLATLVKQENAESIELTNNIIIEIATCSYRTVRGRTVCAALLDEVAFFPSEDASSPDYEVINAIRPAMATIPGSMMLIASSPYARKGALWDAFNKFYGKPDAPALVWKAATRTMNSTVPQLIVDQAIERDASAGAAEFLATFRDDVEALVTLEVVRSCIKEGVTERLPERRWRYTCGIDVSGGVSDSSTLCICHREQDTLIVDAIIERRAPHSPEVVCEEFATFAKTYRVSKVYGDAYAGQFRGTRYGVTALTTR
jgi:phage terminase large subunit-like protein